MSLVINANYALVTDTDGHVTFDSRDRLLHPLTKITGTKSIAALPWSSANAPTRRHQSFVLGAVHPRCTHVEGAIKIVYSTGYNPFDSGGWYMAGGTFIPVHKVYQGPGNFGGTWGRFISSMSQLSLRLSGSTVVLDEDTVLQDDGGTGEDSIGGTLAAMTITYRIIAGSFT